jgi:DNA-binding Lrp family transcriptional regulator
MLTDLLRALADDSPRTMSELASELGTDPAGLRLAIDHCERSGYLERMSAGVGGGCCDSCRSECGSACGAVGAAVWWRVTERGRRAARMVVVERPA